MTIKETSAYIKGLIEGANLDVTTPEGKVIAALADLCGKMASEIETLRDELDVCNAYIEEIDEDLGEVEEFVYEDLDDCDCCDCCDDDEKGEGYREAAYTNAMINADLENRF